MLLDKYSLPLIVLATLGALSSRCPAVEKIPAQDAWRAMPKYEYGQDMAPLLVIDREVIHAMASPETRSACAARLARLLASAETTLPARQYICLQLRQVGTSAEVPLLAKLLAKPTTSEMARQALEAIPGPESLSALRTGLTYLQGGPLAGVIHSVAVRSVAVRSANERSVAVRSANERSVAVRSANERSVAVRSANERSANERSLPMQRDVLAVPTLQRLADSPDKQVAAAALWALGHIANERAAGFLAERAEQAGFPTPHELARSLLRCAEAYARCGDNGTAKAILQQLSQTGQPTGVRRAALEGLLCLQGQPTTTAILRWLADSDTDRRRIALGHLDSLPAGQLDALLAQLPDLPDAAKLAVVELASSRRGEKMLSMVMSLAQSSDPKLQLAGIRALGVLGDASATALLVDRLSAADPLRDAAHNALVKLSSKETTAVLLDALRNRPAIRKPVIAVLRKQKCYAAIDPLITLARESDPDVYALALNGLSGIADPDKTDIARLVKLLLKAAPGGHRDAVEKTILIVCNKLPTGADRSALVFAALERVDQSELPSYLPLLGRLGGSKALEIIQLSLQSDDQTVHRAAVRALCNWPNAEVAEELLDLATHAELKALRRWALRAYVRVVTLSSDRPESATLAMLKDAMQLADNADDKRLTLQRAATIRTMDAVTWIAHYLDDPKLAQTACRSVVELAHHRFLRHPNMDRFGPVLEKVGRISKDPAVAERAKRYRLGL